MTMSFEKLRSQPHGVIAVVVAMAMLILIGAAHVRDEQSMEVVETDNTAADVAVELLEDDNAQLAAAVIPPSIHNVRILWMEVTAYCPCKKCCGPQAMGLTASGKKITYNNGRFVAADTDVLPFGTKILVPGYHTNQPIEVIDRGGAIKGHKLDVFYDSHEKAMEWGRKWVAVTVIE